MKIYEAEKQLGLAEKIGSQASLIYEAPIKSEHVNKILGKLVQASMTDEDNYFMRSILVSVGWNKNDDVFTKVPVWNARKTPIDKQLNMEHDSKRVVGHITDCYAIDEDGAILSDSISEASLPDKFHLVTPSVLYRFTSKDEELEKEMETVIAEIEDGKWFVSMECLFDDFDYAMQRDGKSVVMARNSATAHLSKSLKAYGGEGTYTDHDGNKYKVGRAIKDLTFSGKGLTKKPANPESIILANLKNFDNYLVANDLGYLNKVETNILEKNMAVENDLAVANTKLASVESTLVAATKKNEELEKQVRELSEKEVTNKLTVANTEVAQLKEKVTSLEASVKTEQTARTDAETKLAKASEDLTKANEELAKVKTAQVESERVSKWIEKTGVEKDVAVKAVKASANLSDENFGVLLDIQKKVEKTTATEPEVPADKDNKKVLGDAEKEKDATLASAGEQQTENYSALASMFKTGK